MGHCVRDPFACPCIFLVDDEDAGRECPSHGGSGDTPNALNRLQPLCRGARLGSSSAGLRTLDWPPRGRVNFLNLGEPISRERRAYFWVEQYLRFVSSRHHACCLSAIS